MVLVVFISLNSAVTRRAPGPCLPPSPGAVGPRAAFLVVFVVLCLAVLTGVRWRVLFGRSASVEFDL